MKRKTLVVILCLASGLCPVYAREAAAPLPEAPVVGFVTHLNQGSFELLAESSVTAELGDLLHWQMENLDEESPDLDKIHPDWSHAEAWLSIVGETGRMGFPIIDTAMHHTYIPWRHAMTGRAGQNHVGPDGTAWNYSSLHAPLFRASVFRYIEQVAAWFREHDTEGRVSGYVNGAEWFYPGSLDYSPMALSAFHAWLPRRYGGLDALNDAWGTEYSTWEAVEPPRVTVAGTAYNVAPTFAIDGGVDASVASEALPVVAGTAYVASARSSGDGPAAALSLLHIAWLDAEESMVRLDSVRAEPVAGHEYALHDVLIAPETAVAVQMHCKLLVSGEVAYYAPRLAALETGLELTKQEPEQWAHFQIRGASSGAVEMAGDALRLSLAATPAPIAYEHPARALEDWVVFSYEAMADWLNRCAVEIKKHDPGRPVVSYVGFVFAQQAQWDYAMSNQRLDISLANTPDIDVNGIQMCIAGADFTWAAHIIDTARKYGKPVWATDLVDFPYGLYSGFESIYRGTLAAVQHGMEGVFWYGWKGVPDYSFSERMATADRERLLRDTRLALETVQGFRPHITTAQLMPLMSYSMADEGGHKGDMLDNGGLYRLLLDSGITPDVWTPYEVERQEDNPLLEYEAVFISDCPVLPAKVYEKLVHYARSGGRIISSGRLPEKDLGGRAFDVNLADLPGVENFGEPAGRRYWGNVRRVQVHGNTPPVLVEDTDPERTPEMRRALRDRLEGMMRGLSVSMPVRIVDGNGAVHITPFRNAADDAWLLFLVHKGSGRCPGVEIQLNLPRSFSRALAWRDFDTHEKVVIDAADLWQTPDFAHSCIVTLE